MESKEQSCDNCAFSSFKYEDGERLYECRRHSPQVGLLGVSPYALWPPVLAEQWCGDYESWPDIMKRLGIK